MRRRSSYECSELLILDPLCGTGHAGRRDGRGRGSRRSLRCRRQQEVLPLPKIDAPNQIRAASSIDCGHNGFSEARYRLPPAHIGNPNRQNPLVEGFGLGAECNLAPYRFLPPFLNQADRVNPLRELPRESLLERIRNAYVLSPHIGIMARVVVLLIFTVLLT